MISFLTVEAEEQEDCWTDRQANTITMRKKEMRNVVSSTNSLFFFFFSTEVPVAEAKMWDSPTETWRRKPNTALWPWGRGGEEEGRKEE